MVGDHKGLCVLVDNHNDTGPSVSVGDERVSEGCPRDQTCYFGYPVVFVLVLHDGKGSIVGDVTFDRIDVLWRTA